MKHCNCLTTEQASEAKALLWDVLMDRLNSGEDSEAEALVDALVVRLGNADVIELLGPSASGLSFDPVKEHLRNRAERAYAEYLYAFGALQAEYPPQGLRVWVFNIDGKAIERDVTAPEE